MSFRVRLILFALAYGVGAELSYLLLLKTDNHLAFWPPAGLYLAMLLATPQRLWWPVLLAASVPNFLSDAVVHHQKIPVSLGLLVINLGAPLVGAALVTRLCRPSFSFAHLPHVMRWSAVVSLVSTPLGALAGATLIMIAYGENFAPKMLSWWLGDLLGVLLVTPLAYGVLTERPSPRRAKIFEAAALLLSLGAATALIFRLPGNTLPPVMLFFFLLWAALRFGVITVSAAAVVLAVIALWMTARGFGPFSFQATPSIRLYMVQLMVITAALLFYILAAAMAERLATERRLRDINIELEQQVLARTAKLVDANEQLRASEKRLQLGAEVAGFALFEIDYDTQTYHLSAEAAALYGLGDTSQSLPCATLQALFHPDDSPHLTELIEQSLEPSGAGRFADEHRIIRPDGTTRWLNVRKQVFFDHRHTPPRPARGILAARDITARKEQEVASAQLAAIVSSSADAILSKTLDGVITSWNVGAQQMFGYTSEEIVGQSVRQLIPPDLQAEEDEILARLRNGDNLAHYETVRVTKGGQLRDVSLTISPIKNSVGQIIGASKIIRDITERKRLEEKLRAQFDELENIYHTAPIGLALLDCEGRFVRINERLAEINGIPAQQHIGRSPREIVPDLADQSEAIFQQILASGEPVLHVEMKGETAAQPDVIRIWDESWHPLKNAAGEIVSISVVVEEITERKQAEEAVRRSEANYRTLFNAIDEGFARFEMIFDDAGQPIDLLVLETNEHWARQTGLGDITGKTIRSLFPDYEQSWLDFYGQVALTGKPARREDYTIAVDRWYSTHAARIGGADSRQIALIFDDITERKRHEQNLHFLAAVAKDFAPLATAAEIMQMAGQRIRDYLNLSHCLFVQINEATDEAIVQHDTRVSATQCLEGYYRLTGFHDATELQRLASGLPLVISDVYREPTDQNRAQQFASLGIRALLNAPYLRDGRWQFVLSAMHSEPHEWQPYEIELLRELSERIYLRLERARAEERLHAAHDTFRHLVENSPFGVYVVDADFRLAQVGAGAQKVFENVRPLLGRDFAEVMHILWPEPAASEFISLFRHTLETGEPYHAPSTVEQRQDISETEAYDWKIERIALPDGRFGVVCHYYDLSERLRYEAEREQLLMREQQARQLAEEANRAKDDWLAMVTHELRSPLNAILGHARVLEMRRALLAPEFAEFTAMVRRNGERQNELINDLLDTARMATGKLQLEPGPVSLSNLIADALDAMRPTAQSRAITLLPDIDLHCGVITADAARLQQVVWNLLTNAVKFTPVGGSVSIIVRREPEQVRITVSDTGQGIEPDFLPYVFERFSQADTSRSRRYGGLGLGLALVKQIVELHGGTITAASEGVGRGATFTLMLPVRLTEIVKVSERAKERRSERERDSSSRFPQFTTSLAGVEVMLLEDETDAREFVSELLSEQGVTVQAVTSAADAWPLLTDGARPQVLVCDIGLPEEDGYSLLTRLRGWEQKHGQKPLPALALTAHSNVNERLRALQSGFQMHVAKPVDPEELLLVLKSLLERSRMNKVPVGE